MAFEMITPAFEHHSSVVSSESAAGDMWSLMVKERDCDSLHLLHN
jgi:hypothetical protein